MRTLTLKRNHILFGFLLMTLALSKSWMQTAPSDYQVRDFASVNEAEVDITYNGANSKDKKERVKIRFTPKTTTGPGTTTVDPATGAISTKPGAASTQLEATIIRENGCATCISPKLIPAGTVDAMQVAIEYAKSGLEDLDKKVGDLEARRKAQKDCKIRIEDESDKSKDVKLTKREHLAERLQCKLAKLDEDEDMSDRTKFREFKKLLSRQELRDLVFSDDEETSEIFQELLSLDTDNEYIEQYLVGLSATNEQFKFILESAETLANRDGTSMFEQNSTRQSLLHLNQLLMSGNYPTDARSKGAAAAFNEMRGELLKYSQRAIQNPSSVLMDSSLADINSDDILCDSIGRGCRTEINGMSRMPRISPMGIDSFSQNGQVYYDSMGNRDPGYQAQFTGGRGGRQPMGPQMNTGYQYTQSRPPMYAQGGNRNAPSPYPYNYQGPQQNTWQRNGSWQGQPNGTWQGQPRQQWATRPIAGRGF